MITMFFSHLYGMKPQKIEEVCDTPAELLASQDPARGLADSRRKGNGFLKSTRMFLFVHSLKYLSIFTNLYDFYTFTFFYIILTLTDMALS